MVGTSVCLVLHMMGNEVTQGLLTSEASKKVPPPLPLTKSACISILNFPSLHTFLQKQVLKEVKTAKLLLS